MTDKPILFSGPMVRAILDGRKTQTRRLLKSYPPRLICRSCGCSEKEFKADLCKCETSALEWTPCELPKYRKGDRLWVREAWLTSGRNEEGGWELWDYALDAPEKQPDFVRKMPSIHMPRVLSRLTLTVTEVRVQRLQEISEEGAMAEGVGETDQHMDEVSGIVAACSPTTLFRTLWDSLNAKRAPWASNPWVAAYTFTVDRRNIDADDE